MIEEEGTIKFNAQHVWAELSGESLGELAAELSAWRWILRSLGLIGQDASRYGGAGFGNMSVRVPSSKQHSETAAEKGAEKGAETGAEKGAEKGVHEPSFLITGSQSGEREDLRLEHYCLVEGFSYAANSVRSRGSILPSSESLTHAAIYQLSSEITCVVHVHAPRIWTASAVLELPTSAPGASYGTQAMAQEMARLYRESDLAERKIVSMAGHEDGVIAFAASPAQAAQLLIEALARARRAE